MTQFSLAIGGIRRSIFVKLLLIFSVTSLLAISFIVYSFHKVKMSDAEIFLRGRNRLTYGKLLIDKMGFPPSEEVIQSLATEALFKIRIESPHFNFTSGEDVPSFAMAQKNVTVLYAENPKIWTGRWNNDVLIRIERGGGQYLFVFSHAPLFEIRPDTAGVLITVILLLFLATYVFTRWLFSPIKKLSRGVDEVSLGHLTYQVDVNKSDELGDLAKSFNLMTSRLQKILSAKEQLLLDVSHDLRSPLTRINVALAVGGKEEVIRQDLKEMEAMLAELLESARLDSDKDLLTLKPENLSSLLVGELYHKYKQEPPGVVLQAEIPDVILQMDQGRLRTALKNIIENALKFSPPAGQPVEISLEQTEQNIVVGIQDHGIGIAPEEQSLVFEPFYRVDKSRSHKVPGYGLGLSLAKKIIEAHGGRIVLESALGVGTKIQIFFKK